MKEVLLKKTSTFYKIKARPPTSWDCASCGDQMVIRRAGTGKGTLGTNSCCCGMLGKELAGQEALCTHRDHPAQAGESLTAHYGCLGKGKKNKINEAIK